MAQSVVPFTLPHDVPALAVAYAFSDTVAVFQRRDSSGGYKLWKEWRTGLYPGPADDLPRDIVALDANHDGYTDLVVLHSGNPTIGTRASLQLIEGRPGGDFIPHAAFPVENGGSPAPRFPVTLAARDLNRDGYSDLVLGYGRYCAVGIWKGMDMARFQFKTELVVGSDRINGVPGLALVDLDGDGMNDILAGSGNKLFYFRGWGGFQFQQPQIRSLSSRSVASSVAVADFNRNSFLDVIVGDSRGVVFFFPDHAHPGSSSRPPDVLNGFGAIPSNGISDVGIIDWNHDSLSDIVAVNRLDDSISIISPLSLFQTVILATAHTPRRVSACDVNGDGAGDLVTANEGDLTLPGNADLSFIINRNRMRGTFEMKPVKRISLPRLFSSSLGNAGGATQLPGGSDVFMDVERRALVSLDSSSLTSVLHYLPNTLTDDVTGIASDGDSTQNKIYLIERMKPRITIMTSGRVSGVIPLPDFPEGGISGLVYDPIAGEFWFLAPERKELWVVDQLGSLVRKQALDKNYTRLAVDFQTGTIFLGDPSSSRIDRLVIMGGAVIPLNPIILARASPVFHRSGVSAMTFKQTLKKLSVVTTSRVHAYLNDNGSGRVHGVMHSLSRGKGIVSLTRDPKSGDLYALDLDAVPGIIIFDRLGNLSSVLSLESVIEQNRFFFPGSLAHESRTPRGGYVLVADYASPLFVKVCTDGSFNTVDAILPSDTEQWRPIAGFDIDHNTGGLFIRSRGGLLWTLPDGSLSRLTSMDGSDPGDVSLGERSIYSLAPLSRRLDKIERNGRMDGFGFFDSRLTHGELSGVATDENHKRLYIVTRNHSELLILEEEKVTLANSSWNMYE